MFVPLPLHLYLRIAWKSARCLTYLFFFLLCHNCFTLVVAEEHGSKPGNVKLAVWRKCTPYARGRPYIGVTTRGELYSWISAAFGLLFLEDKQPPSSYLLDNVGTKIIKRSFNSSTMKKAGTIQASKYSRLIRRLLKNTTHYLLFGQMASYKTFFLLYSWALVTQFDLVRNKWSLEGL